MEEYKKIAQLADLAAATGAGEKEAGFITGADLLQIAERLIKFGTGISKRAENDSSALRRYPRSATYLGEFMDLSKIHPDLITDVIRYTLLTDNPGEKNKLLVLLDDKGVRVTLKLQDKAVDILLENLAAGPT